MREAAAQIRNMGARAVLIKGGHLSGDFSIDVLDDEGEITVFRGERIHGAELHGSGCILSAAIAAGLGKGMTLENAVAPGEAVSYWKNYESEFAIRVSDFRVNSCDRFCRPQK